MCPAALLPTENKDGSRWPESLKVSKAFHTHKKTHTPKYNKPQTLHCRRRSIMAILPL